MGLIAGPAEEKPKALTAGEDEEEEVVEAEPVEAEAKPQEEGPPVADAQLLEEFERLSKEKESN
jgi:hypothetical protein